MHPFRTDSRAGRTIYQMVGAEPSDADQDVGRMDTPELAAFAVAAMNAALALSATVPAAPPPEVVEQPEPSPIEPIEPVEKKQCPKCLRLVAVRHGGQYLAPHNDEKRGGKPCDGRVGRPATPSRKQRTYHKAPDNLVDLLAKHNGSAAKLAHELGIPSKTAQNWKQQLMKRERLAALPLVDRTDDRPERSGAA